MANRSDNTVDIRANIFLKGSQVKKPERDPNLKTRDTDTEVTSLYHILFDTTHSYINGYDYNEEFDPSGFRIDNYNKNEIEAVDPDTASSAFKDNDGGESSHSQEGVRRKRKRSRSHRQSRRRDDRYYDTDSSTYTSSSSYSNYSKINNSSSSSPYISWGESQFFQLFLNGVKEKVEEADEDIRKNLELQKRIWKLDSELLKSREELLELNMRVRKIECQECLQLKRGIDAQTRMNDVKEKAADFLHAISQQR